MSAIESGINITIQEPGNGCRRTLAAALAFHLILCACFAGILDLYSPVYLVASLLPGAAIIILLVAFDIRRALLILLSIFVFVWLLMDRADGLFQLLNRLFALSEASQSYRYSYFLCSAEQWRMTLALVMLSSVMGALCFASTWARSSVFRIILPVSALIVQIYFGVFAPDICIMLLVLYAAWAAARPKTDFAPLTCILLALTFFLTCLLPIDSEGLRNFSERIRDNISLKSEDIALAFNGEDGNGFTDPAGRRSETENSSFYDSGEANPDSGRIFKNIYEPDFSGAQAGLAQRLLSSAAALALACAALASVPVMRYGIRRRRVRRSYRLISNLQPALAIDAMFRHSMSWISCYSDYPCAAPYSSYAASESVSGFREIYDLWEKTAYGNYTATEGDRYAVQEFMSRTIESVRKRSPRGARLHMILYLYPPQKAMAKGYRR